MLETLMNQISLTDKMFYGGIATAALLLLTIEQILAGTICYWVFKAVWSSIFSEEPEPAPTA